MATLVKFYFNEREQDLIAFFPQLNYNKYRYGNDMKTSYAHIGQHSGCHIDYIKSNCRPATQTEYKDLKKELEGQGYILKVSKINLVVS